MTPVRKFQRYPTVVLQRPKFGGVSFILIVNRCLLLWNTFRFLGLYYDFVERPVVFFFFFSCNLPIALVKMRLTQRLEGSNVLRGYSLKGTQIKVITNFFSRVPPIGQRGH